MADCPFCNLDQTPGPADPNPGDSKRAASLPRRAWRSVQWLFPTTLLVLMPKCPMCVVAYVAMFTGMGISVPAGRWIRMLMLVLCWTALAYLAFRHWRWRQGHRI